MCYTGLLKRFVPFALTFAVGLFIASFFVSIALPEANWQSRRGFNKRQELERLQADYDSLRRENLRLKSENEELRSRNAPNWDPDLYVPQPDLEEHHPPAPPKRPKQPRFE